MPKLSSLETEIRTRLESLATELAGMIRQSALESVREVLGGEVPVPMRSGPSRARGRITRRKPGRQRASARGRGRSSSAATESLAPRVLSYVKANPGRGVTEIAAALDTSSEAVKPVVAAMLAANEIRKTGQRRGTKYHANSAASPKKAARKAPQAKRRAKRKPAAKHPRRKTRRSSRVPIAPAASKALPIKTIPAQRAAKASKSPAPSVERKEPSAVTPPVGAEVHDLGVVTAKESRSNAKRAVRQQTAAKKSATQEPVEELARKA